MKFRVRNLSVDLSPVSLRNLLNSYHHDISAQQTDPFSELIADVDLYQTVLITCPVRINVIFSIWVSSMYFYLLVVNGDYVLVILEVLRSISLF